MNSDRYLDIYLLDKMEIELHNKLTDVVTQFIIDNPNFKRRQLSETIAHFASEMIAFQTEEYDEKTMNNFKENFVNLFLWKFLWNFQKVSNK